MPESGKKSVSKVEVQEDGQNQRLDNYLFRLCKGVPKSHICRIVRNGEVRVNGKRAVVSDRLRAGDLLRIPPIRVSRREEAGAPRVISLPVVYEDDALLVIDKPSGIAVHGGSGISFGVIETLRRRSEAKFLELAHRLDKETSGLLLIAKKRSALTALHETFREGGGRGRADKRYLVLVCGRWMDAWREVKRPLLKYLLESGERRVRVSEEGKASRTVFRLLSRWENFSLLEAELKTGRTHQIRVHCASLGFPVAGDDKYGDFSINRSLRKTGLKRLFLHAWKIALPHPAANEPLILESPPPDALKAFLARLSAREKEDYREAYERGPAF